MRSPALNRCARAGTVISTSVVTPGTRSVRRMAPTRPPGRVTVASVAMSSTLTNATSSEVLDVSRRWRWGDPTTSTALGNGAVSKEAFWPGMSRGGSPEKNPPVGSWLSAAGWPPAGFTKGRTPGRAIRAWSVRRPSDDRTRVREAPPAGVDPAT